MIGSGRKRISKWDLKEVPQLSLQDIHNGDWPAKTSNLVHKTESPGWQSPDISCSHDRKWYGAEGKDKDGRELSDAMMAWNEDGSYSTTMSPGLEDWRQQSCNHSPKRGCDGSYRSRSRSPHGFKWESRSDRSIRTRPCKYFGAGRCKKGNDCPYLHQDDKDSVDRRYSEVGLTNSWEGRHTRSGPSKYFTSDDTRDHPLGIGRSDDICNDFLQGNCHKGASCKYAHHSAASDGIGRGSVNEVFRERENDRRNKGASFEHSRDHESFRGGNIPCKFFAAGNCRNGKSCWFSHSQRCDSSDDRSLDGWRRQSNKSDNGDQLREFLKRSDKTVSNGAKLLEWSDERKGNVALPEQRAITWSVADRWEHNFSNENISWAHPTDSDKAVESSEGEYFQLKSDNTGTGKRVLESRGTENWLGDLEISPAWNHRLPSSNHITREEPGHVTQTSQSVSLAETTLQTCEQDIARDANLKHHTVAAMQPVVPKNPCSYVNPNSREDAPDALSCKDSKAARDVAMSHIDLNFSASVVSGQNQQAFAPYAPRGEITSNTQNPQLFLDGKSFCRPDIGVTNKSEVMPKISQSQNIVSREQLSQLTNLSASIARLLENGKHLPQLYAALNGSNSMEFMPSTLPHSPGPAALLAAASVQANLAVGSQKQYDPISDSSELIKSKIVVPPTGFASNSVEENSIADANSEMPLQKLFTSSAIGEPGGCNSHGTANSEVQLNGANHQLNKLDPVAKGKGEEDNGMVTVTEEGKKTQDDGPSEKIDGDDIPDESRKNNDAKGIRAFKFALAEFVKELLKPAWKESQISKESHKIIVKKVVDKVTGSIQAAHIPVSQEKIDNYMTSSKPKLSKLVQAYVEKYQKS